MSQLIKTRRYIYLPEHGKVPQAASHVGSSVSLNTPLTMDRSRLSPRVPHVRCVAIIVAMDTSLIAVLVDHLIRTV